MNFEHFFGNFLFDKNYLLLFLTLCSGLCFSAVNSSRIFFFNFLKPIVLTLSGLFVFRINIQYHDDFLRGIMIAGVTLSFIISSLIGLRENNDRRLNFLVFSYFCLLILLFTRTFLQCNLFHLFIVLELLAIIGFIFIIIDYADSKIDLKSNNKFVEKQNSKKNIAIRYFITHCFSGLLFMIGIIVMIVNGSSISIVDIFQGKTQANYFIVASLLINIAVPFFSFWFVQSYSTVRFSFSLIMMSGVSKISLFLLFLITKNQQIPYLEIIGVITMIYGSIMTLQEINIRRFFCYALISHNGFLILAISQRISYDLFLELMVISFVLQNLLASFIFLSSFNSKEYYFLEIEKNIKKYKSLFIFSILTNWIFISMPYSIGFVSKNLILSEMKDGWVKNGFYWTTITNIFSHLFVFNYRLFSRKKLMFSKSFSQNDYIKNICIFAISTIPIILLYIFIYKNNISPTQSVFLKYFYFSLFSSISFLLLRRFFTKNQFLPYDITIIFEYLKQILNLIFDRFKKIEDHFEKYFEKLKEKTLEIPGQKKYLNSYSFALIFFFSWICFIIYWI